MTTITLAARIAQFVAHVTADNTARDKFRATRNKFNTSSRDRTYQMLADALAILSPYINTTNQALLDELAVEYVERGIKAPKSGENPWFPGVKMLFGYFHPTEKVVIDSVETAKFITNASANKYANVLRFAATEGWKPADLQTHIEKFEDATHGNKMIGIIKADQHRNRSAAAERQLHDKMQDQSNPNHGIYEVIDELHADEHKAMLETLTTQRFIKAVLRKADDGSWIIMGLEAGSEKAAEKWCRTKAQAAMRADKRKKDSHTSTAVTPAQSSVAAAPAAAPQSAIVH